MAILRKKEMRALEEGALDSKMSDLRNELNSELGAVAAGGRASNPGRIKELRRTIARILTLKRERSVKAAPKAG